MTDVATGSAPVLVVGGGTVGHLAPGFALADALRALGRPCLFATPGEGREREWFPDGEPEPLRSPALRLPRRRVGWFAFPFRLLAAVRAARRLLGEVRPAAVVGLGGWPCVPAVLAARRERVPVVLIASDTKPGVAVRRLAPLATRIYVAWGEAAQVLSRPEKVVVTGPVLRSAVLRAGARPEAFGLEPGLATLLVTGGSSGALAVNRALAHGLEEAARREPTLTDRVQILHSVGQSGEGVAEAYTRAGFRHHVTPFLRDMGGAYGTADLVVSRAGALTCAELAHARVPAVLVPYPHHKDRQQYANARRLVERGGALLLEQDDLDEEAVRTRILALLEDSARLEAMSNALRDAGSDGAGQIALDLVRLLRESPGMDGSREDA